MVRIAAKHAAKLSNTIVMAGTITPQVYAFVPVVFLNKHHLFPPLLASLRIDVWHPP